MMILKPRTWTEMSQQIFDLWKIHQCRVPVLERGVGPSPRQPALRDCSQTKAGYCCSC